MLCKAVQASVHIYASLFFIEISRGNLLQLIYVVH